MLLVTAISILTGSNTLTILLVYQSFSFSITWQYKANIWEELLILGLTLPYI